MTSRDQLLTFLNALGFRTGKGHASPYGQPLPLVTGWAFDEATALVALFVEDPEHLQGPDVWRELLFALSGLRHELRRGRSTALGAPVVFALLADEAEAQRLHSLVEHLTQQYLLFSRVELNAIVLSDPNAEPYRALAPLLPRCRDAVDKQIVLSHELLDSLSSQLQDEISELAERIDPALRSRSAEVGRDYSARLAALLHTDGSQMRPPLEAWRRLVLTNFRSFASTTVGLKELTLVEGLNGTGKSSIIEALEILWAGTTQRKPIDDDAKVFDRHLSRNGVGEWTIAGTSSDQTAESKTASSTGPSTDGIRLARNVLTQDSAMDIASESRANRYAELLRMTGLAVPELLTESERLNRDAKAQVDRVLVRLNLQPLKSIAIRAVDQVRTALSNAASYEVPSVDDVREAESILYGRAKAIGLSYREMDFAAGSAASARLASFRQLATRSAHDLSSSDQLVALVRQIYKDLIEQADVCAGRAQALDVLAAQVVSDSDIAAPPPRDAAELPAPVALAWLHAGRALRQSVGELRRLRSQVRSEAWRQRLDGFLQHGEELAEGVPYSELDALSSSPTRSLPRALAHRPADLRVLAQAGLSETTVQDVPSDVQSAMTGLAQTLRVYVSDLKDVADRILECPLVRLRGVENDLHDSLARFEMARQLKGPLTQAQETLLNDLIRGPLEPVLAELISALTRFEWYFQPFEMAISRGQVRFGGLAVPPGTGLDVRMLLNAGEREIVTIAWFLALHMLQRPENRKVLVLDDPFSQLDENNQAALLATLRVVTRLTRPQLVLITCHERVLADTVEREFAKVAGWPSDLIRLRCARKPTGESMVQIVPGEADGADLASEIQRLGLRSDEDLPIAQTT